MNGRAARPMRYLRGRVARVVGPAAAAFAIAAGAATVSASRPVDRTACAVECSASIPGGTMPGVPRISRMAFNFKDTTIESVLNYVAQNAGLVLIVHRPMSGRVSIESRQPVTADEAIELLRAVLRPTGYVLTRSGGVLKVTTVDRAKAAPR